MTPSMQKLTESRWFKEGVHARVEGSQGTTNPYGAGSPKALLWDFGFESADDSNDPTGPAVAPVELEEGEMVV